MKPSSPLHLRAPLALVALTACLTPSSASASSLLLNAPGGWNGFYLEAKIEAGYRPAGSASGIGEVSKTDQGFLVVAPDTVVANETLVLVSTVTNSPLATTSLPDSGSVKDTATGDLSTSFTVGTPTTPDSFNFNFNSTTSAELAQVDFGSGLENADAFFRATITLRSSHPAVLPGAAVRLPDLPILSDPDSESLEATFSYYLAGSLFSGSSSPGDTGPTLPLNLVNYGEEFVYQLNYEITTPYGTDPTYGYSFAGGSQIPEPTGAALVTLATLTLATHRRRDQNRKNP